MNNIMMNDDLSSSIDNVLLTLANYMSTTRTPNEPRDKQRQWLNITQKKYILWIFATGQVAGLLWQAAGQQRVPGYLKGRLTKLHAPGLFDGELGGRGGLLGLHEELLGLHARRDRLAARLVAVGLHGVGLPSHLRALLHLTLGHQPRALIDKE
eukprot:scaffold98512_cov35-Prasinocladus_malaysianus.AAC.1